MTRARKKILDLAKELGFTVESLEWTPLGRNMEMAGIEGGWVLKIDEDGLEDWIMGENVDQLLEAMKVHAEFVSELEGRYAREG